FTARQRAWAASISWNAIASPAVRELGPLVTLLLKRTVAKVDSMVRRVQMDPMLRRAVVELQQHVGVVDDLRHGLRELRAVVSFERGDRRPRLVGVLGVVAFLHRRLCARMRRLRKRSKGIRLLVEPTTLLLRLREDVAQRFPEAQRAVADREDRGARA